MGPLTRALEAELAMRGPNRWSDGLASRSPRRAGEQFAEPSRPAETDPGLDCVGQWNPAARWCGRLGRKLRPTTPAVVSLALGTARGIGRIVTQSREQEHRYATKPQKVNPSNPKQHLGVA